jgi:hypothetical protein
MKQNNIYNTPPQSPRQIECPGAPMNQNNIYNMESLTQFNDKIQNSLPKIQTVEIQKKPEIQKHRSHSLPQLKTIFQNSLYLDRPNEYV